MGWKEPPANVYWSLDTNEDASLVEPLEPVQTLPGDY